MDSRLRGNDVVLVGLHSSSFPRKPSALAKAGAESTINHEFHSGGMTEEAGRRQGVPGLAPHAASGSISRELRVAARGTRLAGPDRPQRLHGAFAGNGIALGVPQGHRAFAKLEHRDVRLPARLQTPDPVAPSEHPRGVDGARFHCLLKAPAHREELRDHHRKVEAGILHRSRAPRHEGVRAERMRQHALVQRRPGHAEIHHEPARVRDVEDDAPLVGAPHRRAHPALLVHDGLRQPGEAVSQDVAGAQPVRDLLHRHRGVADVHHESGPGGLGGLEPHVQHPRPVLAHHLGAHADLDADDDIRVGGSLLHRALRIGVENVAQLPRRHRLDTVLADVDKGEDTGPRLLHHVAPQAGKVDGPRRPAVYHRGHAGRGAVGIGVDGKVVDAPVDVSVHVDKARRDVATGRINRACCTVSWQSGRDRRDPAAPHPNVHAAVQSRAWIEHGAARDQEIEALSHLTSPRALVRKTAWSTARELPVGARCTLETNLPLR